MPTLRLVAILAIVFVAAAATVGLAYGLSTIGVPVWQVAVGPVLLVVILVLRWYEARHVAAARADASSD